MRKKLNKNNGTAPFTKRELRNIYSCILDIYHALSSLLNDCFFCILKVTGIILLKITFRIQVENKDKIPRKGPLIVAPNHFSYIDPIALQAVFPRRISFMMTDQFYEGRVKWLFKLLHCICVKGKGINITALREGLEVLKENGVLGIFPEGSVSKEGRLQEGNQGVGFLAKKSGASVIPVFLSGTYEALPKGKILPRPSRIKVVFGNPILVEKTKETTKEKIEKITREIMEEIEKLSP
jgi:1-acyl-sn-glycerol-3-phosphate acyltransferase